jgi:hypothetical protein
VVIARLGRDTEVGTEKSGSYLGNQFLGADWYAK